jgi:hypothetical protein
VFLLNCGSCKRASAEVSFLMKLFRNTYLSARENLLIVVAPDTSQLSRQVAGKSAGFSMLGLMAQLLFCEVFRSPVRRVNNEEAK